jgi:hypothetical protein
LRQIIHEALLEYKRQNTCCEEVPS